MRVPVDATPVAPPGVRQQLKKRKLKVMALVATSPTVKSNETEGNVYRRVNEPAPTLATRGRRRSWVTIHR